MRDVRVRWRVVVFPSSPTLGGDKPRRLLARAGVGGIVTLALLQRLTREG